MTKQTVLAVIKRKNILYILYKRDFVDFAIHDIGHVQAQNACGCSLKKKKLRSVISVHPFTCLLIRLQLVPVLSDWHLYQISQLENIFESGSRISRLRGASPIYMINFLKKRLKFCFRPPLPLH